MRPAPTSDEQVKLEIIIKLIDVYGSHKAYEELISIADQVFKFVKDESHKTSDIPKVDLIGSKMKVLMEEKKPTMVVDLVSSPIIAPIGITPLVETKDIVIPKEPEVKKTKAKETTPTKTKIPNTKPKKK